MIGYEGEGMDGGEMKLFLELLVVFVPLNCDLFPFLLRSFNSIVLIVLL